MSEKKYQRANLSFKMDCEGVVSQINNLIKKIKSGNASARDLEVCEKLTDVLQNGLKGFLDLEEFDRWVARETIDMSRYTCRKYGHHPINDKI